MKQILGLAGPAASVIQFTIWEIAFNVFLALLIGMVISYTHKKTSPEFGSSDEFSSTIVLTTMTICIVMMIIGDNLVLSLGLVGALSIVRFRTVIKSNRDLCFLFMGIAGGLGTGSGSYVITIIGMISLITASFILFRGVTMLKRQEDLLLMATVAPEEINNFLEFLREKFSFYEQRASLVSKEKNKIELTLALHLHKGQTAAEATEEISNSNTVDDFSLHLPDRIFQ